MDFLQVGRGRTVTIHRGQDGCRYPSQPDLTVKLEASPLDLSLVRVQDLDADGLSDLSARTCAACHPDAYREWAATAPDDISSIGVLWNAPAIEEIHAEHHGTPIVTFVARRDLLHKRGLRATGSAWLDADSAAPDLERAKLTT